MHLHAYLLVKAKSQYKTHRCQRNVNSDE